MSGDLPLRWQPNGRPLAEPPVFDYDEFVDWHSIPSDVRLRRLFAKDIAMGYRYRDVMTEGHLLWWHWTWADDVFLEEVNEERRLFYQGLKHELRIDHYEVGSSWPILEEAMNSGVISELGWWEHNFLDEDGGTTNIERKLHDGMNIFDDELFALVNPYHCEPAFQKYGHLIPPGSEVFRLIEEAKARAEEDRQQEALRRERSMGQDQDSTPTPSTTSSPSTDSDVSWHTVTPGLQLTDQPPSQSITDPIPELSTSSIAQTLTPEHQPSALTAENGALRKRMAQLEAAGSEAKRQI